MNDSFINIVVEYMNDTIRKDPTLFKSVLRRDMRHHLIRQMRDKFKKRNHIP